MFQDERQKRVTHQMVQVPRICGTDKRKLLRAKRVANKNGRNFTPTSCKAVFSDRSLFEMSHPTPTRSCAKCSRPRLTAQKSGVQPWLSCALMSSCGCFSRKLKQRLLPDIIDSCNTVLPCKETVLSLKNHLEL